MIYHKKMLRHVYSQISIDKKSRMADHVIDNLGDKLELKQNLQQLLEEEGYIDYKVNVHKALFCVRFCMLNNKYNLFKMIDKSSNMSIGKRFQRQIICYTNFISITYK